MQRTRFLLSTVVALSLSTLALANSAPITVMSSHSNATFSGNQSANASHFSANSSAIPPTTMGRITANSNTAGNTFMGSTHGTISHQNGNWAMWHEGKSPMATPEPGSLLLLSTGIIGMAGMVRRKIQRKSSSI